MIGSMVAAHQTKITKKPHFTGLADSEPPDVLVFRFEKKKIKNKEFTGTRVIGIEITRCALDKEETIFKQIGKKNKYANKGFSLVIDATGGKKGTVVNMNFIHQQLAKSKLVFSEVLIIGPTGSRPDGFTIPNGTFGIVKVYPTLHASYVNVSDKLSFYRKPEIIVRQYGVSFKKEGFNNMGAFGLLRPEL